MQTENNGSAAVAAPFDQAAKAIAAGQATAHALWVLLNEESEREGYALKPMPWEGPGEYQHVEFKDGRNGFVMIPMGRSLPTSDRFKVRVKTAGGDAAPDLLTALQDLLPYAAGYLDYVSSLKPAEREKARECVKAYSHMPRTKAFVATDAVRNARAAIAKAVGSSTSSPAEGRTSNIESTKERA